jgi:hypothetical protein
LKKEEKTFAPSVARCRPARIKIAKVGSFFKKELLS